MAYILHSPQSVIPREMVFDLASQTQVNKLQGPLASIYSMDRCRTQPQQHWVYLRRSEETPFRLQRHSTLPNREKETDGHVSTIPIASFASGIILFIHIEHTSSTLTPFAARLLYAHRSIYSARPSPITMLTLMSVVSCDLCDALPLARHETICLFTQIDDVRNRNLLFQFHKEKVRMRQRNRRCPILCRGG